MKILICGASGFLGKNIYDRLKDKYKVFGVAHTGISDIIADLRKQEDVDRVFESVKPDVVIQMAATSTGVKDIIERPYIHVTDNAVMNSLLLRACYDHNVKYFIMPSCTNVYPSSDNPHKETDPTGPHEKYLGGGGTKVYIENMCKFFGTLGRTKHLVLRHSNIYGPYDDFSETSHVMAATIRKVMNGEITIWGDGTEKRDVLFVEDFLDFVELAVEKQLEGTFNVGSGEQISITELTEKVMGIAGEQIHIEYDNSKPTIKMNLSLDCTKANNVGWKQKVSLEEGIKKTMEWYNEVYNNGS